MQYRANAIVLACLLTAALAGCQKYPTVSRPAFDLAKAISNMCNTQNAAQIERARELVAAEHETGAITDDEMRYLNDILDDAEAGRWERADRNARRLIADQTDW